MFTVCQAEAKEGKQSVQGECWREMESVHTQVHVMEVIFNLILPIQHINSYFVVLEKNYACKVTKLVTVKMWQ